MTTLSRDRIFEGIKMASYTTYPALLSPRPHIAGVGRGRGCDVFIEFIRLSPLTITCIKSILGLNTDNTDFMGDFETCLFRWLKLTRFVKSPFRNVEINSYLDNPSTSINGDCPKSCTKEKTKNRYIETELYQSKPGSLTEETCHPKDRQHPNQVIDRNESGIETLVPYSFNKMTIKIFDIFTTLNIHFETEIYKPKEQRTCVDSDVFYCKNLFLKDRKGQYYLVICHEDTNMDLKQLRKTLKAYRNFNFVSGEEMKELIGTDPGGVTPLALIFASSLGVSMVISKTLYKEGAFLMFHPLDSRLATKISLVSLLRFLKYIGHSVIIVD